MANAGIVFACVFGSAILGMIVRQFLPAEHLTAESKDVVKLAMGLIATTVALVLGLLTGSAKSSFDAQDNEIKQTAAELMVLDRTLAQYGPDTKDIRDQLRRALALRLAMTWPEDPTTKAVLDIQEKTPPVEEIEDKVRALA